MSDGITPLLAMHDAYVVGRALHLAARLGVADHLADGPRAADDLATATSTDPDALRRLLRALAGSGVFTEVTPDRFGLTPLGDHLRSGHPHSIRSFLDWGNVVATAFEDAEHSLRTGTPAFDRAFGAPFFDHLHGDVDMAVLFNAAMAELSVTQDAAVVDAYDFAGIRSIVDVGGGRGSLLRTVLAAHPEMTGLLFDQPSVVDTARDLIAAAGLADRCTVEGGDFFREIPAGRDAYLLKSVIHDWPDEQAAAILHRCRAAIPDDGRLVLVERVPPPGDTPHPTKPLNLVMLILVAGRERTEDEYAALLAATGFRITDFLPTDAATTVIVAAPH